MNIQLVFNHYRAVTYLRNYLSKQEDECSQAIKQAVKEAAENNLDNYQQIKSVSHAYSSKRKCSLQESVYDIIRAKWFRKIFPGVIYANSDLPEKRLKMILSEKEIAELPDNNTDLFKRKMIDLYIDRPSFEIIEYLCFAIFLRC